MLDAEAPRVARGPRRAVWGVKQRTNSNELHPTIRPGYTNVPHRVGNRSNDIVSVGMYGALHRAWRHTGPLHRPRRTA